MQITQSTIYIINQNDTKALKCKHFDLIPCKYIQIALQPIQYKGKIMNSNFFNPLESDPHFQLTHHQKDYKGVKSRLALPYLEAQECGGHAETGVPPYLRI